MQCTCPKSPSASLPTSPSHSIALRRANTLIFLLMRSCAHVLTSPGSSQAQSSCLLQLLRAFFFAQGLQDLRRYLQSLRTELSKWALRIIWRAFQAKHAVRA